MKNDPEVEGAVKWQFYGQSHMALDGFTNRARQAVSAIALVTVFLATVAAAVINIRCAMLIFVKFRGSGIQRPDSCALATD